MSVKYAKEAIIRHTFSHHHPNSAGYDNKFHHINNKKLVTTRTQPGRGCHNLRENI